MTRPVGFGGPWKLVSSPVSGALTLGMHFLAGRFRPLAGPTWCQRLACLLSQDVGFTSQVSPEFLEIRSLVACPLWLNAQKKNIYFFFF